MSAQTAVALEPDAGEFDLLFQRYFAPLTRQVARMVECEHVAEELVQDVFLKLWSARDEVVIRGELSHYLSRAARNRALDWLRREVLHREWEQLAAFETTLASESSQETDEAIRIQAVIADCVAQMPARRRAVCELRWCQGIAPRDIAAQLGISLNTVEVHITQGAKDVRVRLRPSAPPVSS